MKKIIAAVLLIAFTIHTSLACTTFFLTKNGQMVFGRNYDWITATGMVNTNLRGKIKTSMPINGGKTFQWTSKYGSVTFNQYGKEFPTGGMNETGLVVELMWLDESQFPKPDERHELSVLQWIQYQLDNCSTIDEVKATDKTVRINAEGTPQHYLVADSKGGTATIEFLNGKMVVHAGAQLPYPVLTNSTYEHSASEARTAAKSRGLTVFEDNSIERFSTACTMINNYKKADTKKPIVDYSFDILKKVAQGDFTKWSIVYDITNKQVHFKTNGYQQVNTFNLSAFDFACTAKPVAFNMNQVIGGNIDKQFSNFSDAVNRKMLKEAFANSADRIHVEGKLQDAMADLAAGVKCR